MKIVIIASDNYPHIGGKSTHISDLVNGFRELQIETDVYSVTSIPNWLKTASKAAFVPIWLTSRGRYIFYYRNVLGKLLQNTVERACGKGNPDFVIFEDADSATFFADYIKRHNTVSALTMHTYFGLELKLDSNANYQDEAYYKKALQRELKSLEVVCGVVCVDTRIRNHVADTVRSSNGCNISEDNIVSIKNFTNIDIFSPAQHISSGTIRIICVRRLVEKNGVICLVRAMIKLRDLPVKLEILGDGPETSKIELFIKENDLNSAVTLVGSVPNDNVIGYYHNADIAVVPSITVNGLQEATSISAIEAMSCGLATIASRIGGLRELIDDYKTGVLVDEQNADMLSDKIRELCCDAALRERIGSSAREYVVNHHSHINAAEKYLSCLKLLR